LELLQLNVLKIDILVVLICKSVCSVHFWNVERSVHFGSFRVTGSRTLYLSMIKRESDCGRLQLISAVTLPSDCSVRFE